MDSNYYETIFIEKQRNGKKKELLRTTATISAQPITRSDLFHRSSLPTSTAPFCQRPKKYPLRKWGSIKYYLSHFYRDRTCSHAIFLMLMANVYGFIDYKHSAHIHCLGDRDATPFFHINCPTGC